MFAIMKASLPFIVVASTVLMAAAPVAEPVQTGTAMVPTQWSLKKAPAMKLAPVKGPTSAATVARRGNIDRKPRVVGGAFVGNRSRQKSRAQVGLKLPL
jgi:hypothetical protein